MSSYFERSKDFRSHWKQWLFHLFMEMKRMVTKTIFDGASNWALGLFSMRIIGKNGIMFLYFLEEKAGYENYFIQIFAIL